LEETGDVMMQAVFQASLQQERGAFNLTDAVTGVCEKLITRHTHVFGEDAATDETQALSVWDKNKMTEKNQHTFADAVNDVPTCFPALLQAQKIAKRLSKGGWAFENLDGVKKKLTEELCELERAVEEKDKAKIKEELGDFLMCAAWLCRAVGADGEEALLETLAKIKKRYTAFEKAVLADGKDVNVLEQEEWQAYYKRAKEQACN
jgi:tetrapyrrole methylase family protein/MazG family protein